MLTPSDKRVRKLLNIPLNNSKVKEYRVLDRAKFIFL
jgi:hypothetical protein